MRSDAEIWKAAISSEPPATLSDSYLLFLALVTLGYAGIYLPTETEMRKFDDAKRNRVQEEKKELDGIKREQIVKVLKRIITLIKTLQSKNQPRAEEESDLAPSPDLDYPDAGWALIDAISAGDFARMQTHTLETLLIRLATGEIMSLIAEGNAHEAKSLLSMHIAVLQSDDMEAAEAYSDE